MPLFENFNRVMIALGLLFLFLLIFSYSQIFLHEKIDRLYENGSVIVIGDKSQATSEQELICFPVQQGVEKETSFASGPEEKAAVESGQTIRNYSYGADTKEVMF